jgi:hypothetical protein
MVELRKTRRPRIGKSGKGGGIRIQPPLPYGPTLRAYVRFMSAFARTSNATAKCNQATKRSIAVPSSRIRRADNVAYKAR